LTENFQPWQANRPFLWHLEQSMPLEDVRYFCSTAAAKRKISFLSRSFEITCVSFGLPSVNVPVLSNNNFLTFSISQVLQHS